MAVDPRQVPVGMPRRRIREVALFAAGAKDEPVGKPDVALHNAVVRAGAHRAFHELEPKLASLIEPVLRGAGRTAAAEFTRLAGKPMTALTSAGEAARAQQTLLTAQEAAAQAAALELQSAMDELTLAEKAVTAAKKAGNPKLIASAERRLVTARDHVRRALQAVTKPSEPPPLPAPTTPAPPKTTPTTILQTPTTIGGQVNPPTTPGEAAQVSVQGKTQEIFTNVPGLPDQTSDGQTGGTLEDIERAIQEAGYVAQPDIEHLERIENVKPIAATWSLPAGDELLNVQDLAAQVRDVTDPVRLAVVRQIGTPIVEGAGLRWDDANPFSAKVLAQSASQITAISQTTQANVMQIIQEAHDNGWTIPDTAKAIQQGMTEASPARATLIARTELAGAVNGGSLAATQIVQGATGVQYAKVWETAPGAPHPRHENYPDLDGQVMNQLDGYFTVGDAQLRYPGDPDGPPGEVCNCRCTLIYQEISDDAEGDTGAPLSDQGIQEAATGSPAVPGAPAIPPSPPLNAFHTSDPMQAAQALAGGQYVVLEQPDQISTFIDDLGKISADAQAAGRDAPNLDLGRVSVKGTNLFTQDSLGVPRIDMPQLAGDPLPGSPASKLVTNGFEGDPNSVDIGPLFYQQLRNQGVKIQAEDVLASHLRATQKDINGGNVAKLMDRFEDGTATERVIPVSRDNYILDGHHEWAATVGADWKTGIDAGLKIPVMKIDQPITQILAEARSFGDKYGMPQVSAYVPKVTDAAMTARLALKDPILGITPFRGGDVEPLFRGLHGANAVGGAAASRAGDLGGGDLGKGIYLSRSVDLAQGYAQSFSGDKTGVVIRGGLHPDAKVATEVDIPKGTRYPADWAKANGYDAYDDGGNVVVVVNPAVVTWDPVNYTAAETAAPDWAGRQPITTGDNPVGFYDSARAKQFESDLRSEAAKDNLTLGTVTRTGGVWEGATEPSYSVHVYGDQAKVAQYAETLRNRYDQDGVMVFTPQKDLPANLGVNSVEYRITGVDPDKAVALLSKYGFSGATTIGREIEIVGSDADGANAAAMAAKLGGTFSAREGHVQFVERK